MSEIWHPCVGYETHYEVSSIGRVRSISRYANNGHNNGLRKRYFFPVIRNHCMRFIGFISLHAWLNQNEDFDTHEAFLDMLLNLCGVLLLP